MYLLPSPNNIAVHIAPQSLQDECSHPPADTQLAFLPDLLQTSTFARQCLPLAMNGIFQGLPLLHEMVQHKLKHTSWQQVRADAQISCILRAELEGLLFKAVRGDAF